MPGGADPSERASQFEPEETAELTPYHQLGEERFEKYHADF